jgi:hypothetical protein
MFTRDAAGRTLEMPNTARRTYKDMTPIETTRDPARVPILTCNSIIDTRKYFQYVKNFANTTKENNNNK